MRRAYLVGARLAVQCWQLVSALWLISVAFGASFFLASGYWLHNVLDGSLVTRTLLYDLDPHVFIDLYYRQDAGFPMLIGIACVMGVVYLLLWCWLHGAVIFHTCSKGHMPLGEALVRGVQAFPRMLQLLAIALTLLALFSGGVGAALWCAFRATAAHSSEMLWYSIGAAALAAWLLGCVFLTAIHDHARIRACQSGEGAAQAYWWALRFVVRGGERAFLLAALLQFTALAVGILCQAAGLALQVDAGLGMAIVFVWGELSMYIRMMLRVWFFGAQGDLQSPA